MAPPILVINSGSSSLKLALIEVGSGQVLRQRLAERLGTAQAGLRTRSTDGDGNPTHADKPLPGAGHAEALEEILAHLGGRRPAAVGHRVVHGGETFSASVVLNDDAVERIRACNDLAPLHNPPNVLGIEIARRQFPELAHVAVFDTAFHQTLPAKAFVYAVPYELYERHRVRRYGFHGTSHAIVAGEAAHAIGRPLEELQLITAHLGNGCSACAIKGGRSVDTTMGFTPLEGLVMGSRSGDVDPNLHQFLADQTGRSLAQITDLLNRQSGLLGLSGASNDMRTLLAGRERGDVRAALAIDVFCYRLAKALLGLCAALERIDALVSHAARNAPPGERSVARRPRRGHRLHHCPHRHPGRSGAGRAGKLIRSGAMSKRNRPTTAVQAAHRSRRHAYRSAYNSPEAKAARAAGASTGATAKPAATPTPKPAAAAKAASAAPAATPTTKPPTQG